MTQTVRRLATTFLVVLAVVAAVPGCGGESPPFDLRTARAATVSVTVRESVSFREFKPKKTIRFAVSGTPVADSGGVTLSGEIVWVDLTYVDRDGARVVMSTESTPEEPLRAPLQLARRAVIEGLVRQSVDLMFSPDGELILVDGLRAATRTAERAALADGVDAGVLTPAAAGIAQLLEDERVRRGLFAAGMTAAPPEVPEARGSVERDVEIHVAGRGVAVVRLQGKAGVTPSGEPSLGCSGRITDELEFTGDPGAEPPEGIGPVVLADTQVQVSTEYTRGTWRPLRGNVRIELPHEKGPVVRRGVEFVLVVKE